MKHHSPFQHSILNLKPVTFRNGDEKSVIKVPKPSLSTGLAGLAGARAGEVGPSDAFGLVGHALKDSAGSTVQVVVAAAALKLFVSLGHAALNFPRSLGHET
jgi:hypothetical protein